MRLYRAGSPDEGQSFWTPSEAYARLAHPEAAMHEAVLLPSFIAKTLHFSRSDPLVQKELEERTADVLIFHSADGAHEEYVILNPAAIKVEK